MAFTSIGFDDISMSAQYNTFIQLLSLEENLIVKYSQQFLTFEAYLI